MDGEDLVKIGVILIVLIGIGAVAYGCMNSYNDWMNSQKTSTITVSEKWIKESARYDDSPQYYLVSDTNNNVYKVADESAVGAYDASNRYAKIKPGKTYQITTIGWRQPSGVSIQT
jgi:hypothetical protein